MVASTIVHRRTSWNPYHCWTAPAGAARPRPRPASTEAFRHATKGRRYPPDPPTVEEIIAVMRAAGDSPDGLRLRGVIVDALARRAADQRSARAQRDRSRPRPRRRARPPRQGRQASRGRDGPLGMGAPRAVARSSAQPCRSARCSASCAAQHADGRARPPGSAPSCITPLSRPVFAAGSRRTSCGTRTRSRCPARGSR